MLEFKHRRFKKKCYACKHNVNLQLSLLQIMAVKQRLERDSSDLTQKLCRAEQALLAAQAKESDLTRSFEVTNAEE